MTDAVTSLIGFTLLNTNTWFLVEIMLFYMAFYVIYKYIKKSGVAFGLMTGFVLFTIVISLLLGHDSSELNGHWFMGEWWYWLLWHIVPEKNYKEEVEQLATIQVGEYIYFGTYDIEPLGTGERIEWYVAERQADKVLLVAVYGLNGAAFQQAYEATNWEDSSIREIINSEFIDVAFTEQEQELITTTKIVTEANSQYGTDGGSFAYDKVFLLSVEEAEKYFANDDARRFSPTTMAGRRGMNVNPREGSSWWWLCTMGAETNMAAVVSVDGEINLEGERVNIISGGVRPAMWVMCKEPEN